MSRFDSDDAAEVSRETYAPLSDAGNRPPRVRFELNPESDLLMAALPPGACIRCEAGLDASSRVVIVTNDGSCRHIANVTVHATGDDDLTTETIAIASALYWSWWRAMDMRGETPVAGESGGDR